MKHTRIYRQKKGNGRSPDDAAQKPVRETLVQNKNRKLVAKCSIYTKYKVNISFLL